MGFLDDVLNGGLDRNFDGDIDSRDRHIMEFEVIQQQREREYQQRYYEEYDFDDDFDDYDYYGYSGLSSLYPPKSEREKIIDRVPVFDGVKRDKKDVALVEWENMPSELLKKAKGYQIVWITLMFFALTGASLFGLIFTDYGINFITLFGLVLGIISVVACCFCYLIFEDLTTYYTHINDKNGNLVYRSGYSLDKELEEFDKKQKD